MADRAESPWKRRQREEAEARAKDRHQPVTFREYYSPEHAHRPVERGEVPQLIDLHLEILRRKHWYVRLVRSVRKALRKTFVTQTVVVVKADGTPLEAEAAAPIVESAQAIVDAEHEE